MSFYAYRDVVWENDPGDSTKGAVSALWVVAFLWSCCYFLDSSGERVGAMCVFQ